MSDSILPTRAAALTWGATVIAAALISPQVVDWWKKFREKYNIPTKWRKVGEISELLMYPLKSGAGISLEEAEMTPRGLRSLSEGTKGLRDRYFMVVGYEDRKFRRSPTYPKMVCLKISTKGDGFVTIKALGSEDIVFKIPENTSDLQDAIMWFDEEIKGIDCGDEVSKWISNYLTGKDEGTRLLYCIGDDTNTYRNPTRSPTWKEYFRYYSMMNGDVGGFSDIVSYSMMSESSLSHLRKCVSESTELTAKRFRSNLVVKGTLQPFEEDDWKWVKINDTVFRKGKPCTRCASINVHPELGTADKNHEPLRTLNTFRCFPDTEMRKYEGDSPEFGIYLGMRCLVSKNIKIGDSVYVNVE